MNLKKESIWKTNEDWKLAGVELPQFDYETVKENTFIRPKWIHFGAGNIFRAFQCALQQDLLNKGHDDTGIIVAEGFDFEIIEKVYKPNDNNGLLVTLKVDGTVDYTVVSSVIESLTIDQNNRNDYERLISIFENENLQMVSFTITEKGYSVTNSEGVLNSDIQNDVAKDIALANSYMGKLVSLLHHRFIKNQAPIALVSMDNVSHNGDKLKNAVLTIAKAWYENGFVDHAFLMMLEDPEKVSYPWSMIDKITPRPDDSVKEMLLNLGFEDAEPIITSKGTYIAPFVNAEEAQYLVIEDHFPNGRPQLEKAGVIFTNREIVDKVERMKVTTCLNPLHTALAVFGCLLGYTKISDEMQDKDLVSLVERIGYEEGLPVVVNPGIIEPKAFIDEVLQVRFPNPFMPDTPQRIATDTSQKLSIRFLETIKSYEKSNDLNVESLTLIPLVIAAWIRYLMGVDDSGNEFELSSDPLMDTLIPIVSKLALGSADNVEEVVTEILKIEQIFAIDLFKVNLGMLIIEYVKELVSGTGAVRETLRKHLGDN